MTWPSGDPNQPQYPRPQHPPPGQYPPQAPYPPQAQYPPAYGPPQPPPMPYQQAYGQPPGGHPHPTPKKSRKVLITVLSVVAILIVGGIVAVGAIVYFATKDKVAATALTTGDCLGDIPDSALVSLVPKVDCTEPHSGEVFAVLTIPDGGFPGEATIDQWQNKCPPVLQSYSPATAADASVGVFVLYPTADTWAKGDRTVTCIATTDEKRTGSIKG